MTIKTNEPVLLDRVHKLCMEHAVHLTVIDSTAGGYEPEDGPYLAELLLSLWTGFVLVTGFVSGVIFYCVRFT